MQRILLAISLMVGMCAAGAIANYTATVGSGTNFLSFDSGGVKSPAATLANSSGTEVGTAAAPFQVTGANGTFPVSGTVTAIQSGTWTMQPGNTANTTPWLATVNQGGNSAVVTTAGADGVSNTLSALATYSRMQMYNGTTWDRVLGDTTNGLWVNVKSATGLAQGATASGTTGSGIMGEGRATEATAVTSGQMARIVTDLVGKLITLPYANPENYINPTPTASITDTTLTQVMPAIASFRNYVTYCKVTNSHATVGTYVGIFDGSTRVDSGFAAAAGGGFVTTYVTPIRGTTNTAINCQAETTGASFKCSCGGYKGI